MSWSATFRSLKVARYRTWAIGAFVSNIGTWMQRTAQDWLVLSELTDKNATAVGVVMALQFGPQLILLPFTGLAADRVDRRRLLLATQGAMGTLALGLGLLTVTGLVRLWHVYVFALLLGCATAFDAPARQTFVSDLVGETDLPNAVSLGSASFNAARMIGPAIAGILIPSLGSGWVFLINAASFVAVLVSLATLRDERPKPSKPAERGRLTEGFRYVWRRRDLTTVLVMFGLVGAFTLNFPIFISTMAVTVFHKGAGGYGLLTSIMAIGSVSGALLSASRARPTIVHLLVGATALGVACGVAALAPGYLVFGVVLVFVGISAQTFTTTANGVVQLSTEPGMRGRAMAILMALALGTTPFGGPLVGWVADHLGPRWAMGVGAAGALAAAVVALTYLARVGKEPAPVTRGA